MPSPSGMTRLARKTILSSLFSRHVYIYPAMLPSTKGLLQRSCSRTSVVSYVFTSSVQKEFFARKNFFFFQSVLFFNDVSTPISLYALGVVFPPPQPLCPIPQLTAIPIPTVFPKRASEREKERESKTARKMAAIGLCCSSEKICPRSC